MNRWGLFPWFSENGGEHVHPDDLAFLLENPPYGHVMKVIDAGPEFLTLRFEPGSIRVRSDLFREVPAPAFDYDQEVAVLPSRTERTGTVARITWHHEEAPPLYFLRVDGRVLSGRYFDHELEACYDSS